MATFYRFISQAERDTLLRDGIVHHKENKLFYFLSQKPTAYIVPSKYNYNIELEQLFNCPLYTQLEPSNFLEHLIGTTSTDYLVTLELNPIPHQLNLGWYSYNDTHELCIIEHCKPSYCIQEVQSITPCKSLK